jgi:hypothetical protein
MTIEVEALTVQRGTGVDGSPQQRPGIPQERQPPEPLASAHWLTPDRQQADEQPLVGRGLSLTPVFSTAIPARGLSGVLRRLAYGVPDYKARRWLLLMVADRIDVIEHRPALLLKWGGLLGAAGLGVAAMRRRRRG